MTIVAHICAWCNKTLELTTSTEYDGADYVETHTICPSCEAAL